MRVASALLFTGLAITGAHAADYLRGAIPSELPRPTQTSSSYDWSGFFIGGQAMYQAGIFDQSRLGNRLGSATYPSLSVATNINTFIQFDKPSARGSGFGVFAGYNSMWDDVVLGVEGEYNRGSMTGNSTFGPYGRDFANTDTSSSASSTTRYWDTSLTAQAKSKLEDYGVARLKAGVAYDRFLPYVTLGVAGGRISNSASNTATTQLYELQPVTDALGNVVGYNRINMSSVISGLGRIKDRGFHWGYAVGAGMDVAVTDNLFLRGHWEYLSFGGSSGGHTSVHNVKGGAGVKF